MWKICHICSQRFFLCLFHSVTFEQSSAQVVNTGTEELRINCSHDGSSLQVMLWYQHKQSDQAMSLIGFTVLMGEPNYESQFRDRFQIKRDDTVKGSLIIKNLNLSDSAVYFCAASTHSLVTNLLYLDSLYLSSVLFVQKLKHCPNYEAYFGQGTKLTVLENSNITAPKVKILEPSEHECKNGKDKKRKKTLVCVASGFYPDHVEVYWQIDRKNITDGVATDEAAERIETPPVSYRITSRLRVSAKDWFTEGKNFTCIVSFYDGNAATKYNDTIFGVEEKYLKITNKAKLSYAVFIFKSCLYGAFVGFLVWRLQDFKLNSGFNTEPMKRS
ncbi:capicua transcriptional repressor [Sarotherodon galilaeus]